MGSVGVTSTTRYTPAGGQKSVSPQAAANLFFPFYFAFFLRAQRSLIVGSGQCLYCSSG